MSDSEQCSNRLQLDQILILINLSCQLGQIMTIYDVLEVLFNVFFAFKDSISLRFWHPMNVLAK